MPNNIRALGEGLADLSRFANELRRKQAAEQEAAQSKVADADAISALNRRIEEYKQRKLVNTVLLSSLACAIISLVVTIRNSSRNH